MAADGGRAPAGGRSPEGRRGRLAGAGFPLGAPSFRARAAARPGPARPGRRRRRWRGRHPRGAFGSFPSSQGQVPSVRASAASPRRATRVVPCASALPPAAAPSAGPVRGWPRAPGSGPRGFSAAEPGGGLKTRAARGGPRGRPGSPSAAGGARRLGVGARGRAAPPRSRARSPPAVPALAPRGRQGRRGVGARPSLRGPVSAETPRARAVGRRRPRPRQQGAETRVSAPRPRRALGGVACRAVSGGGQRGPARAVAAAAVAAAAAAAPLVPCRRAPAASPSPGAQASPVASRSRPLTALPARLDPRPRRPRRASRRAGRCRGVPQPVSARRRGERAPLLVPVPSRRPPGRASARGTAWASAKAGAFV